VVTATIGLIVRGFGQVVQTVLNERVPAVVPIAHINVCCHQARAARIDAHERIRPARPPLLDLSRIRCRFEVA